MEASSIHLRNTHLKCHKKNQEVDADFATSEELSVAFEARLDMYHIDVQKEQQKRKHKQQSINNSSMDEQDKRKERNCMHRDYVFDLLVGSKWKGLLKRLIRSLITYDMTN